MLQRAIFALKNKVASLKEKGFIRRLNGKRNGKWKVAVKPEKPKKAKN